MKRGIIFHETQIGFHPYTLMYYHCMFIFYKYRLDIGKLYTHIVLSRCQHLKKLINF